LKSSLHKLIPTTVKGDRPTFLLSYPEPIEAISLLPDRPPSKIFWRKKSYTITQAQGPERISAEWWKMKELIDEGFRDYFKVCDESGRWVWIFRSSKSMRWYLHGVWA
ncbi:MAG: hypothetical protein KDD53_12990, partial [Bdellovibrionales bacterium]|nr:hypothetical protein [Bdellovibrionales bacterium]